MEAAEASMGQPSALPADEAKKSVSTVTPSFTELFTKLHTPWNVTKNTVTLEMHKSDMRKFECKNGKCRMAFTALKC